MWNVDGPCEVGSLVAWVAVSVADPNPWNPLPRDLVVVLVVAASEAGWAVGTVVGALGEVVTVAASVADAVALEAAEGLGTEEASVTVVDSVTEVEALVRLTEDTVTEASVVEEVVDSEADATILVAPEVAEVSGMQAFHF